MVQNTESSGIESLVRSDIAIYTGGCWLRLRAWREGGVSGMALALSSQLTQLHSCLCGEFHCDGSGGFEHLCDMLTCSEDMRDTAVVFHSSFDSSGL